MKARKLITAIAAMTALCSSGAMAAEIDLNIAGAQTCIAINDGATVCNTNSISGTVGSGVFPSFVGTPGGQDTAFQMYNTTGATPQPENEVGNSPGDNATVQLSQLGVQDGFVIFRLDINQINSGEPERFLSVDEISIFLGDGSLTGYNAGTGQLGGTTALWSLTDADWIKLNYDLAAGSGNGVDMYLLIPAATFAGYALDTHLQLFSRFGETWINNDGFEEWAYLRCEEDGAGCLPPPCTVDCGPNETPEPGILALLGLGLAGVAVARRRVRAR